jgi:hypothetical protein
MKSFHLSHLRVVEVIAQRAVTVNRQIYYVWDSAGESCLIKKAYPKGLRAEG